MTPLSLHQLIQKTPGQTGRVKLLIEQQPDACDNTVDSCGLDNDNLAARQHQVRLHVRQHSHNAIGPKIFHQIIDVVPSEHAFT
jgi:hypothetical protein